MPVGRLDLNTEGLLLLTTDGELKRQLELPSSGVERVYRARVFGEISQDRLEELIQGVEIEGIRYGAIDANLERRTGRNAWVEMKLTEGKNREVRRVLEHLGLQVSRLICARPTAPSRSPICRPARWTRSAARSGRVPERAEGRKSSPPARWGGGPPEGWWRGGSRRPAPKTPPPPLRAVPLPGESRGG